MTAPIELATLRAKAERVGQRWRGTYKERELAKETLALLDAVEAAIAFRDTYSPNAPLASEDTFEALSERLEVFA